MANHQRYVMKNIIHTYNHITHQTRAIVACSERSTDAQHMTVWAEGQEPHVSTSTQEPYVSSNSKLLLLRMT